MEVACKWVGRDKQTMIKTTGHVQTDLS